MKKVRKTTVAYDHQIFAYQRFGGVSRYITELASRLPAVAPFDSCIVAPLHINETLAACSVRQIGMLRDMEFAGGRAVRGAANRLTSRFLMAALRPSLVHWTYFNPIPLARGSRSVLTVYDMVRELFPGDFSVNDSTALNKRRSVMQADHVICISQNTKADLMRLLHVPAEKISVTYLACSEDFKTAAAGKTSAGARPYILYVGQRSGYKGFADAIRSYGSSYRLTQELDFVAFGGPAFHSAESKLFESLGLRAGSVRHMAGSDHDLAHVYRHAHLFIYPSKYEGFGIPPLEAMACGCPVACANTSSIPEVVGEAAILFDPYDPDAMREALEAGCFDSQRRALLIQAGHARAALFSWDRCVRETAQVYSRVLGL